MSIHFPRFTRRRSVPTPLSGLSGGRSKRVRGASLVAVLGLVLAACAPSYPAAHSDPVPAVPPPVLSDAQSTAVLGAIGSVLAGADANLSPATLPARLSGPALAIRTAEYTIALGTGGARPLTQLPMKALTLITPQTSSWPRYELVVTAQPEDLQSPRILVLRQAEPRGAYTLWAWTRLLAGVEMPATAEPSVGSAPLAPDAGGLTLTPQDAITQYVDVLSKGAASPYAASFQADEYRTGLASSLALLQQGLSKVGTAADVYTAAPDQTVSFRTADGGALVVAGISTVTTATVTVPGATFTLRPTEASLAGVSEVAQSEVITWADLVALYIPPAGASAQVKVLAAEHQRVSVTAK